MILAITVIQEQPQQVPAAGSLSQYKKSAMLQATPERHVTTENGIFVMTAAYANTRKQQRPADPTTRRVDTGAQQ